VEVNGTALLSTRELMAGLRQWRKSDVIELYTGLLAGYGPSIDHVDV